MEKIPEGVNWWVPAVGDIVELSTRQVPKNIEDHGEAMAIRELGLQEGKLYRVTEYVQDEHTQGLRVEEVQITYAGGKQYMRVVRQVPGTPKKDYFQPTREYQRKS